jgi:N-acetyl sugar amidotransferase
MALICKTCIYPDTRPDAGFIDGICSGCRAYAARQTVDWDGRLAHLLGLLTRARLRNAPYDCVVPVSGGKDSTYQVLKLRELGARVLAVNAGTDYLSDIGRRNLDNLKRYCDVIEWSPSTQVRNKLIRIGLRQIGDLSYPEHCAIWAIPTRIAVQMRIPLVVWGENPQREYATPHGVPPATNLDAKWVAEFGGMLGLRLSDCVGIEGLTIDDLVAFRFPTDEELLKAGIEGIWLGDYVEWDGWKNAFIAQQYGFEVRSFPVETSLANYENLDNHITVLRDYLRFLKYGYTRATDIACNHIRRGRLTRGEALTLCDLKVDEPTTSLGKPIDEVLAHVGITMQEWREACAQWDSR